MALVIIIIINPIASFIINKCNYPNSNGMVDPESADLSISIDHMQVICITSLSPCINLYIQVLNDKSIPSCICLVFPIVDKWQGITFGIFISRAREFSLSMRHY